MSIKIIPMMTAAIMAGTVILYGCNAKPSGVSVPAATVNAPQSNASVLEKPQTGFLAPDFILKKLFYQIIHLNVIFFLIQKLFINY